MTYIDHCNLYITSRTQTHVFTVSPYSYCEDHSYPNKSVNLKARFFDKVVVFFHSIVLILQRKQTFLFPIFSLKYWSHPRFHDAFNLLHVVFSLLNSSLKIMDTVGNLNDIIPNACSPKETQLIQSACSGTANGLVARKNRALTLMGLKKLFCTDLFHYPWNSFLPIYIKKPTLITILLWRRRNKDVTRSCPKRTMV